MAGNSRIKVEGGVGAIWTGPGDTLPFTDPLNNLGRVKFHSSLPYIQVIEEHQLTLVLPARGGQPQYTQSYKLFDHGKAGFPFVLGMLTVEGQPCAFAGSIPIQANTEGKPAVPGTFARWLSLGADATGVYVHEYCVCSYTNNSFYGTYPSINIPITVWVTNEILE